MTGQSKEKKGSGDKLLQSPGFFFHPDYTVGTGVAPVHALPLADYTAGGEFHSALKNG